MGLADLAFVLLYTLTRKKLVLTNKILGLQETFLCTFRRNLDLEEPDIIEGGSTGGNMSPEAQMFWYLTFFWMYYCH